MLTPKERENAESILWHYQLRASLTQFLTAMLAIIALLMVDALVLDWLWFRVSLWLPEQRPNGPADVFYLLAFIVMCLWNVRLAFRLYRIFDTKPVQ